MITYRIEYKYVGAARCPDCGNEAGVYRLKTPVCDVYYYTRWLMCPQCEASYYESEGIYTFEDGERSGQLNLMAAHAEAAAKLARDVKTGGWIDAGTEVIKAFEE